MNVQDYAKVSPDLAIRLQVPPAKKKKKGAPELKNMKSCYDYHKMLRVSSDINQTGLRSPDMSGQFVHLKCILPITIWCYIKKQEVQRCVNRLVFLLSLDQLQTGKDRKNTWTHSG